MWQGMGAKRLAVIELHRTLAQLPGFRYRFYNLPRHQPFLDAAAAYLLERDPGGP